MVKQPESRCAIPSGEADGTRAGLRGHIVNDMERVHLLRHVRAPLPGGRASRSIARSGPWSIDPYPLVWCVASCIESCPKHCLTMDPAYTPIATAKSCRVVHVPDPKAAVTEIVSLTAR